MTEACRLATLRLELERRLIEKGDGSRWRWLRREMALKAKRGREMALAAKRGREMALAAKRGREMALAAKREMALEAVREREMALEAEKDGAGAEDERRRWGRR